MFTGYTFVYLHTQFIYIIISFVIFLLLIDFLSSTFDYSFLLYETGNSWERNSYVYIREYFVSCSLYSLLNNVYCAICFGFDLPQTKINYFCKLGHCEWPFSLTKQNIMQTHILNIVVGCTKIPFFTVRWMQSFDFTRKHITLDAHRLRALTQKLFSFFSSFLNNIFFLYACFALFSFIVFDLDGDFFYVFSLVTFCYPKKIQIDFFCFCTNYLFFVSYLFSFYFTFN